MYSLWCTLFAKSSYGRLKTGSFRWRARQRMPCGSNSRIGRRKRARSGASGHREQMWALRLVSCLVFLHFRSCRRLRLEANVPLPEEAHELARQVHFSGGKGLSSAPMMRAGKQPRGSGWMWPRSLVSGPTFLEHPSC